MTISEATTKFMTENYPTFGDKSLSFPEQTVDYGLPTQALLLEEDELEKVSHGLDNSEKSKFEKFMKTQVMKGAVSEIEVFNFAKKNEDTLLMATFWSYDQCCFQKLMGIQQKKSRNGRDYCSCQAEEVYCYRG